MKRIFFTSIILMLFLGKTFNAQNVIANSEKELPVTLHHTTVINLKAESNGVTYPVFVCLPGSYEFTSKNYPVIYMLDAYSSFGIVTQMQHLLVFNKELPEAIIVGISSEGGSKEFIYNRARDYTPTKISNESLSPETQAMTPVSGGAEKFLQFIKEQLIPTIEFKYRIEKNNRTLVGHSYGGLFCFYSLFKEPELFKNIVALSPALQWDNNFMLHQEENFAALHKSPNIKIYTAVGALESNSFIDSWKKMIDAMRLHNYTGLVMKSEVIPGETHYTMIPFLSTHGLKFVMGEN
jgi:predicted alpha/beta superfamily hydrolase